MVDFIVAYWPLCLALAAISSGILLYLFIRYLREMKVGTLGPDDRFIHGALNAAFLALIIEIDFASIILLAISITVKVVR